jgi:hypothetical protein
VQIKEKHPFDGPLVMRVAGEDRTIGEKVASQIFVRLVKGTDDGSNGQGNLNEQPA